MPIIPLLCQRIYNKSRKVTKGELVIRYCIYTMLTNLFTSFVMVLMCDEGTSFREKMDLSASFAFKYILITLAAALIIAVAEWLFTATGVRIYVEKERYLENPVYGFCIKYLIPSVIYILAAVVLALNFILIFDNVLWGDEAYAGRLVTLDIKGIFQVLTLEENHPPLYYLWLKLFAEIFGYSGPVYHLASYVPFAVGIIMAVTVFKKHFGKMAASFFVIISGLSASCVVYNMEIRMYQLAFLGVVGSLYCAYRIFKDDRILAWVGIILWALVAAYSHYYALVAVGIMMFVAFAAAAIKYRGKEWVKGAIAMLVFIAAYAPWLAQLFRATKSVSNNWWMEDIETLEHSINMVGCGDRMSGIVLPAVIIMFVLLIVIESAIFVVSRDEEEGLLIRVTVPSIKNWSPETYTAVTGLLSIVGTMVFAYGLSIFMRPLIAVRYFYPLCGIVALMLGTESSRLLKILEKIDAPKGQKWAWGIGKAIVFVLLFLLLIQGIQDYIDYKTVADSEKEKTEATLEIIGDLTEDMQFINDGVQHIGWTVLDYYYHPAKITNGGYGDAETSDVWYCAPYELYDEEIAELQSRGYEVTGYGMQQLSKYPFLLYHFER